MGEPAALGIADIGGPDLGGAVMPLPGEVPTFWGCGLRRSSVPGRWAFRNASPSSMKAITSSSSSASSTARALPPVGAVPKTKWLLGAHR